MNYRRLFVANILVTLAMGMAGASDIDIIVEQLLNGNYQVGQSKKNENLTIVTLDTNNLLEDPEVEFEFLAGKNNERKYNLTVSQAFEWPGVYGARRQQIEIEKDGARLERVAVENEQRMQLRQKLIEIIASNIVIEQLKTTVDGSKQLLELLGKEYEQGNISVLELNRLRIEVANLDLQLAETEIERDAQVAEINSVSSNDIDEYELKQLSSFPLVEFKELQNYVEAAENSPTLQLARNSTLAAQARREVAKRNTLPGFSAGYRLSKEDGILFNGFTVGVSVPLWRAKAENRSAKESEIASLFIENVEKIKIEKEIESAYCRAQSLKKVIEAYGQALRESDNERLLKKAYSSGLITLTQYITELNFFVEANVRYVELQRDFYKMIVQLTRFSNSLGGQ